MKSSVQTSRPSTRPFASSTRWKDCSISLRPPSILPAVSAGQLPFLRIYEPSKNLMTWGCSLKWNLNYLQSACLTFMWTNKSSWTRIYLYLKRKVRMRARTRNSVPRAPSSVYQTILTTRAAWRFPKRVRLESRSPIAARAIHPVNI